MTVATQYFGYLETEYCVNPYLTSMALASLATSVLLMIASSSSLGLQSNKNISTYKALGINAFLNTPGGNMADFDGAIEIRTIRDNETKIILVDGQSGTSATKKLTIAQDGDAISAGVNDFGVPVLGNKAGNLSLIKLGAEGVVVEVKDAAGDELNVNADGSINATVSATNLDIRDLVFATDKVDVSGSAVTVSNTVAVSATDLDIRNLSHTQDSVKVGDGTDFLAISATGEASTELTNAQGADGATAPTESIQVAGKDGSGNLQTLSTDTSGRLNVNIIPTAGVTKVCNYQTTATVVVDAVTTHDYVVTNAKTFTGLSVLVGARGQVFVRVGTYNGTTFTPKFAYFQQPKENRDHVIPALALLGDGTNAIRVEITNKDGQSSDVYSNLQGTEE